MTESELKDWEAREEELHAAHERIEELTNALLEVREQAEDSIALQLASLHRIEELIANYLKADADPKQGD